MLNHLLLRLFNDWLGYYINTKSKNTCLPCYWRNGWHLFYYEDTDLMIGFEYRPSCLMFLETIQEMRETGLF